MPGTCGLAAMAVPVFRLEAQPLDIHDIKHGDALPERWLVRDVVTAERHEYVRDSTSESITE